MDTLFLSVDTKSRLQINKEGLIKARSRRFRMVDRIGYLLVVSMPLVSLFNIFTIAEISGLSIRAIDFLFVSSWIIWGLRITETVKINKKLLSHLLLISGLFFFTLLGVLLLDNYCVDWSEYLRFMQTMLWGVLAFTFIRSERQLNNLINNIITIGVIMASISIDLYLVNPELHRIAGYVSFAGGEGIEKQASYNEWGALYALIMSIFFWRFYKEENLSKLHVVAFVIVVAGLLLVQSRSAFLAVTTVLITLLSSNIKRLCFGLIDKKTLILILSLICAIPVVAMFSKGLAINRLTKSFILGSNAYESMEVRFDLWLRSVGLWTDNIGAFFLGYGSQSIPNLIGSPTADSFYLDHALSEGLLGLMLLLALVITPALQVWSAGHLTREASLGILVSVVALTVSLTGNVLVDPLYGGVTFSLLYGLLSVYGSRNSSLGYSKR
jgi:hypothetical protein